MINLRNDNSTLNISILGYEFEKCNDKFDDNWLYIKVELQDYINNYDFNTIVPCLLTFELQDLKKWFEKIYENPNSNGQIDFIEPCLSFQISDSILTILLNYNLNPKFPDIPYEFKISVKSINVNSIIKNIDKMTQLFPER